ncbi:response regulator transcription factor [Clostridium sp.]|uniref:response regulator transcription factor n=1 Tax=Clostridium sp. TaxID=1506 RepID=UPI003F3F2B57
MKKSTVLIVDDDKDIREIIEIYLMNENIKFISAKDGIEALTKLENNKVDLILLDIMMPRLDGIKTCLKIRDGNKTPIIIISAKNDDSSKILALNIGADDYVTKPFNPLELVARVKSQLRRYKEFNTSKNEDDDVINIHDITIDVKSRDVYKGTESIKLTPIEYDILKILSINRGRTLSTEQIYEQVWKEPFINSNNTVSVHIRNIREKIEINPKDAKYIKVVWGVGYKIEK